VNRSLSKNIFKLAILAAMMYVICKACRPARTGRPHIDELINLGRRELDEVFLAGRTPTMREMEGTVDGNVLSGMLILNNQWFKNFLNLGWFIWRGKVFESVNSSRGRGINRFKIGPFRFLRFHCDTMISRPLAGPNDVFCLDYDLPGNPWYIRRIRDDIKKIDEGLFLGSANLRLLGKHRFVVYFILESARG
jgi:hypothetical protein